MEDVCREHGISEAVFYQWRDGLTAYSRASTGSEAIRPRGCHSPSAIRWRTSRAIWK